MAGKIEDTTVAVGRGAKPHSYFSSERLNPLQTNVRAHSLTCTDLRHFCFSTLVEPTRGSLPGSAVMRLSTCMPHTSSATGLHKTKCSTGNVAQSCAGYMLPHELYMLQALHKECLKPAQSTTLHTGSTAGLRSTSCCCTRAVVQACTVSYVSHICTFCRSVQLFKLQIQGQDVHSCARRKQACSLLVARPA